MTAPLSDEQQHRLDRIEAAPAAPESWPGSLMREPFRRWVHAEVCPNMPSGPTCEEIAEAALAALADAWAEAEQQP